MSNIFGLTTNQLTEVFLQMTGICSFDDLRCSIISNGDAFNGYNAEKVILEFKVIRERKIERFRCFTKKMNFGFSESQIYRNLNLAGAPIPKMYGSVTIESGDEVIFLELLEKVGIDSKNEMEFERLLKTLAHFNSVDAQRKCSQNIVAASVVNIPGTHTNPLRSDPRALILELATPNSANSFGACNNHSRARFARR